MIPTIMGGCINEKNVSPFFLSFLYAIIPPLFLNKFKRRLGNHSQSTYLPYKVVHQNTYRSTDGYSLTN